MDGLISSFGWTNNEVDTYILCMLALIYGEGLHFQVDHDTVEPLIMDTLKCGQPPYNGHTVHPLPI